MSSRERPERTEPSRPRNFGAYQRLCVEGRFHYLDVVKPTAKPRSLCISDCEVLWDPAFGRDVLPVHALISSRFVNRGFACAFASIADLPDLGPADLGASLVLSMAEAGAMPDVLSALDRARLLDGGMAKMDQSFMRDALLLGLTGGAYAPRVLDTGPCKEQINRYLQVFPREFEHVVIALDPALSTWFWNEWIDFFFCVICPARGWAALYAGSDTD